MRHLAQPAIALLFVVASFRPVALPAQEVPRLERTAGSTQLIVGGQPFIILGGEIGNSSAGTASQADQILPRLARAHMNTVLMPVAWEQIEPVEGKFDFSVLDHWIEQARAQHLRLVLLWFGSWKNAYSSYAPEWVKSAPRRFPRAIAPDRHPLEILSTFSRENLDADARAFRTLLRHVKEFDAREQTVIMVQVENEAGILGAARDHSPEADRLFNGPVPDKLLQYQGSNADWLPAEVRHSWNPEGSDWRGVFGSRAPEFFMAWNYAQYIGHVAEAGKSEYPLPMFVNAQLPAPLERAGEYPSGGPHPDNLEIYRAAAPALDLFSPDIYWPNFEYWLSRYAERGTPFSCRRREMTRRRSTRSMRSERRERSDFHHSQSTVCQMRKAMRTAARTGWHRAIPCSNNLRTSFRRRSERIAHAALCFTRTVCVPHRLFRSAAISLPRASRVPGPPKRCCKMMAH